MTSPDGRNAPPPPPVRTSSPAMPSVAHFHNTNGAGWFVITDPAGPYSITDSGGVSTNRGGTIIGSIMIISVLGGGAWAAAHASWWFWGALLFLLGAVGGLLAGGLASLFVSGVATLAQKADDRKAARTPSIQVREADRRAWNLCQVASQISRVGAWQDGTVDPDRRVPAIVWAAAQRALAVDRQYADAQRALAHENLRDLAQRTITQAEREYESLEAVERNLRQVLNTAHGIDKRRAEIAREKELAHRRSLEERELRARLTGFYGTASTAAESDTQADASAGLAAQAEVVADLLAESDRMLREMT